MLKSNWTVEHCQSRAQGVLDLDVDLGAVEGAAAFIHLVSEADFLSSNLEGLRRLLPHGIVAHGLFRPRCDVGFEILEPEGPEHLHDELDDPDDLCFHLLRRQKMCASSCVKPRTRKQAVQHAGPLEPVHRAQFGVPQRQLAVGAELVLVDHDVERAVHRLDVILLPFHFHGRIHVLPVKTEMARRLPQGPAADMRRIHEIVAVLLMLVAPEVLDGLPDERAPRMPQDQAAAHFIGQGEQIQVLAEFPVVAPLDLFEPREVRIQRLLGRERDAVDPLEHLVLLAAAPVGARDGEELEGLDLRRRRHMRPAAEVREIPLLVDRDRTVSGKLVDELYLVRLTLVFERTTRHRPWKYLFV